MCSKIIVWPAYTTQNSTEKKKQHSMNWPCFPEWTDPYRQLSSDWDAVELDLNVA